MPTVAEQLRHAREALKLDVQQVAETTKLKTDQVRALEEGNYEYFTAPIYLRGSIRTYAQLLKLDAAKLIAELETEAGASAANSDPAPAVTARKGGVDTLTLILSRLNWGIAGVVIGLALIALAANASWRAWKKHRTADPLKELSAGVYQPPATGELLPIPTTNVVSGRSR